MGQSYNLVEEAFHKGLGEEAFHTRLNRACLKEEASQQEFQGQSLLRASLEDTSLDILEAFNYLVPFETLEGPACQEASAFLDGIITAKRSEAILTFLFI